MAELKIATVIHNDSQVSPIITIPIVFAGNQEISAAGFSIQLDPCLSLIDSDVDDNQVPDGISIDAPEQFSKFINYDADDSDGQIDFALIDLLPPFQFLPNQALVELKLLYTCPTPQIEEPLIPISFGISPRSSFTNAQIQNVPVVLTSGGVEFADSQQGTTTLPPTLPTSPTQPDEPGQPADPVTINASPTANLDNVQTVEDQLAQFDVLANDGDEDGGMLIVAGLVSEPQNGTAIVTADGLLTYQPNANYHGNDALIYLLSDGQGGTASGLVNIMIEPVNDSPTFVDFPETLFSEVGDVFSYKFVGNDVESGEEGLTYAIFGVPLGVSFSTDGLLSGTVSQSMVGIHDVIVQVTDGEDTTRDFFVWEIQPTSSGPGGNSQSTVIYLPITHR